jgi:hypothetical protein
MTTNRSKKTFAYGIATGAAAIGVLAGSVLTATSASAAAISWGEFSNPDPITGEFISLFAGDKKVTLYSEDGLDAIGDDGATVEFKLTGNVYEFVFTPTNDTVRGSSFGFSYYIEILDSAFYFAGVQVASETTATYEGAIKMVYEDDTFMNLVADVTSVNGSTSSFSPILGKYQKLLVSDSVTPGPMEKIFSLSNKFTQRSPEPGTLLGLLAVGGLGMISRFKRQK